MMTTTVTSLENEIVRLSRRAKAASRRLAGLSTDAKNALLEKPGRSAVATGRS